MVFAAPEDVARLTILLPTLRDRCGRAVMVSGEGEIVFGPFRVLGTASRFVSARKGNPEHDRRLPFGDPPCGTYVIAATLAPGTIHPRRPGRFGRLGSLVLEPTGGDALTALAHGRDHLVLHGGSRDDQRRLRRTRGGLRVGNHNLAALFAAINRVQAAGDPLSVIEIIDVAAGMESEKPMKPATARRDRNAQRSRAPVTALRAGAPGVAIAAMAMFGVVRTSPTRRAFLATALLAVAGTRFLTACDAPDRCVPECRAEYGSGSGSGSGRRSRVGSGSGSGSDGVEACIEACEEDYGTGGGIG